MAMYNTDQSKKRPGERNVSMFLVRSGKTSPHVKYLLSDDFKKNEKLKTVWKEGVLFEHKWGGPLGQDVTIPMGRIVSAGKPVLNRQMNEYNMTMCLPGMTSNGNWVGVAPYNYTKDFWQEEKFGGNMPAVITDKLVVLPYIPSVEAADTMDVDGIVKEEKALSVDLKMPWGAVINPTGEGNSLAYEGGDYLKATPSGRFVKWKKGTDDPMDIVGQIYEIDLNQTQHGFLNWVLWGKDALLEDAPYNKGNMPDMGGWGYDPDYKDGILNQPGYLTPYTTQDEAIGIPGLHDGAGAIEGFGSNDTLLENIDVDTHVSGKDGQTLVLQVKDMHGAPVKNLIAGSVTLKIGTTAVTDVDGTYEIDYVNGKINFTLAKELNDVTLKVDYKMKRSGVPSYLDFKGVVGSMAVLLLK
jgi:hypothetical protein